MILCNRLDFYFHDSKDKQVLWSIQKEEKTTFLLVNGPKSVHCFSYIHWIKAILSISFKHGGQYSVC